MDDHGYDQAACRRAAELLREEAERIRDSAIDSPDSGLREALGDQARWFTHAAVWLEGA